MENHRVFDVFTNYFLGGAQRAPKIDFGRVWGPFESPLGTSFGHVGGSVALLGHRWVQNGARNVKMRVYLAQVEVARGSQRLSGFDFETIFMTSCVLFGIFVYFLVRQALCMQFGTLTWTLAMFSFISAWHFNMVAASHCSCFSQCVERGQGSAAGAAEDHMTCM